MSFLIIQTTILCIIGLCISVPVPDQSGENGNKYGGDMVLTAQQARLLGVGPSAGPSGQTGLTDLAARWPKIGDNVEVPYLIDPIYNSTDRAIIMQAINGIEAVTCVRFVNRTNQVDYIYINDETGCWSYVGKIGRKQTVSIDRSRCMIFGTAAHELIHALGFIHMHQHPDRDERITINWENISPGAVGNFVKFGAQQVSSFNTSFDIKSIMHYAPNAFSFNGRPTITARFNSNAAFMGQRTTISAGDIKRINRMYSCPEATTTSSTTTTATATTTTVPPSNNSRK